MAQNDTALMFMNEEQLRGHIRFCDSYGRLPAMLEISHLVASDARLKVFGDEWSGFDNVSAYADEITDALFLHGAGDDLCHIRKMMDEAECKAFDELPEVLTIYRGAYERNKWGFSWSLDRAVAESFPFTNRYRDSGRPLLVKATIAKSRIAAIKLDRDETEVVTFNRPKCLAIYTAKDRKASPAR